MAAGDDRYVVQSLDRGLELLQILARADRVVPLDELAGLASIPSSTVFRLLTTLERRGLVRRTDDQVGYQVGVGCVELGGAFLASLDLVREARPFMKDLLARFQQTVHLGVLDGGEVLYLEKLAVPNLIGPMIARPGLRTPAHCTAIGKAIGAHLDGAARSAFFAAPREPCTPASIVDGARLEEELAKTRDRGFSVDRQELVLGVHAVAAPVFDHTGAVVGALSVGGLRDELPEARLYEEVGPAVRAAASRLSKQLGEHQVTE